MLLDEFQEHPIRTAGIGLLLFVILASLGIAVFGGGSGSRVQRVATGPGAAPVDVASAAVVWALDARNMLSADYVGGLREVGWSDAAATSMADAAASDDARAMIAAAGGELAVKGGTGLARTWVASADVVDEQADSATVRLWLVSVIATDSGTPTNFSVWQTVTVRLARDGDVWRVTGYENVAGPTPGPSPVAPATPSELIAFAGSAS